MMGEEVASGQRTCPSCGAVLQVGLADQFYCEHCGAPLGEEEQPEDVLPEWLQEPAVDGEPDDTPDWLAALSQSPRPEGRGPTRIELRPTGAADARRGADRRPQTGATCALMLGIAMFVVALFLFGWVVFAIVSS